MNAPGRVSLALAIAGSVAAISTAAVLIRLSDAPPLVVAFYRLLYATLLLAPAAVWLARRELAALSPRDVAGLSLVGVVLAIHFASWITSLGLTSVASSVVLVTLHPVFVGFASHRLFGEGLRRAGWIGVVVALGGGIIITAGDAGQGVNPLVGDVLALVGALAAAVYFLAGRSYRKRLGLLAYVTPVYASAAVTLAILVVIVPAPWGGTFSGYAGIEHLIFLALAAVPMVLGHTVLNWALRYVSAPVIATTILGEPIGASLLALFILGEAPPLATLAGGALVLGGIAAVALSGPAEAAQAEAAPPA